MTYQIVWQANNREAHVHRARTLWESRKLMFAFIERPAMVAFT